MQTPHDVTVYNKYIVSRDPVYQRTQISGVSWQGGKGKSGAGSNTQAADQAVIYIPMARMNHLDPQDWQTLVTKIGKWTLQVGDVIVKGLVTDEITGGFTISDLVRKYNDVLTISDVQSLDYGSDSLNHWQVTAK